MKQHLATLFRKKENNLIKILLLSLGLAMGLVLVAKVYYERVYDNFMADVDRIYVVKSNYVTSDNNETISSRTPGAIAPGIKAYSPAVQVATRTTTFASNIDCHLVGGNGQSVQARQLQLVDTSFFDMFDRPLVGNNPRERLNIKNHVYLSRSFAEKLAGANPDRIIGSMLSPTYLGGGQLEFVVDGIYDDFPENSSFATSDILISLPSMSLFLWDGSNNWLGNDRYCSFVKLIPGTLPADIDQAIEQMCLQQLPIEMLEKAGMKVSFSLEALETYHFKGSNVAKTCTMLLIMALVVLIASTLNYVLIAISAMAYKTKMIGVRKCYGASPAHIYGLVFGQALVHLVVSLTVTGLILYALRGLVEELIGASLDGMITWSSGLILLTICAVVFFFCGLMPAMVYSKIPVAAAFKGSVGRSAKWNPILLFVQFGMSAFFVSILTVSVMQYNHMIHTDPGYSYENIAMVKLEDAYASKKNLIQERVAQLPFVTLTSSSANLPFEWPSGNIIKLPEEDKEYFNVADMYFAGNDYFKLFEIPIIDGRNFTQDPSLTNEVMVNRKFVEKMEQMAGWTDGAVGKVVYISEHSQNKRDLFTICGVYEDYLIGSYSNQDTRPSVQFYSGQMEQKDSSRDMNWLLIKLREVTPAHLAAIDQILKETVPDGDAQVRLYANEMINLYKESHRIRNSMTIAGLIVLLIMLIGLMGYTQDEINRRRSEIAMRKINGATRSEILQLFLIRVWRLAVPAVLAGVVTAYFFAQSMLELYSIQIRLSWWIFALCGLLILFTVSLVVWWKAYNAASTNPIEHVNRT